MCWGFFVLFFVCEVDSNAYLDHHCHLVSPLPTTLGTSPLEDGDSSMLLIRVCCIKKFPKCCQTEEACAYMWSVAKTGFFPFTCG